MTENTTEFIRNIFKVGRAQSLHPCLSESLDQNSALAELHYFGAMVSSEGNFKFPPIEVGKYFDEASEQAKNEVIADFVKELMSRKNSLGFIIINGAVNDSKAVVKTRTTKLVDELTKAGIPCTKLVIDNGLRGGLPGASFIVVHETFFDTNKLKTLCP